LEFSAFKNKKPNFKKLECFGFKKSGKDYVYSKNITENRFKMEVLITKGGKISTKLTDTDTKEPYTLHLSPLSEGSFVGRVKEEYENVLSKIADNCFEMDVFKNKTTKDVIKFIKEQFDVEPEYLWEKFPNNAVFRRSDTQKWFAIIMTVKKSSLNLQGSGTVEIMDLRMLQEEKEALIDNKIYLPGYHMNKNTWFTVLLEDFTPLDDVFPKIHKSYTLAKK